MIKGTLNLLPFMLDSWKPAAFYRPRREKLQCILCPHTCQLAAGEVGICHTRRHQAGQMETLGFAIAIQQLHRIERKPFYHYHPHRFVLTLGTVGCTWECQYCQNYRLSQIGRESLPPIDTELADIQAIIQCAQQHKALLGFSFNEPVLSTELTLALAERALPLDMGIVWKTNGFISRHALQAVTPVLAAVNLDIKGINATQHRQLTGTFPYVVWHTLDYLKAQGVWVEISIPLIPCFNDDAQDLQRLCARLSAIDRDMPVHFRRVVPTFHLAHQMPTAPLSLKYAVAMARYAGLRYVYVERGLDVTASHTYCPRCGQLLIERHLSPTGDASWQPFVQSHLSVVDGKGVCPFCAYPIVGEF